jgi:hypothetical protein
MYSETHTIHAHVARAIHLLICNDYTCIIVLWKQSPRYDLSSTHIFWGDQYACLNHKKLPQLLWQQLTRAIINAERTSMAVYTAAAAEASAAASQTNARAASAVWQLVTSGSVLQARDSPAERLYTRNYSAPLPAGVAVGYAAHLYGAQLREFVCRVHLACVLSEHGAAALRHSTRTPAVQECMRDMRAVTSAKLCELQLMSEQQALALAQQWLLPLAPCAPTAWRQWEALSKVPGVLLSDAPATVEEVFGTTAGDSSLTIVLA